MKNFLITGSAGFIGYHLTIKLLKSGNKVFGIDNLNDYYDQSLKLSRLKEIEDYVKQESLTNSYDFKKVDLADEIALSELFTDNNFDVVINLAAQAGVRYSIDNPKAYLDSNLIGFFNILECCRHNGIKHLVFASSSSVYGVNKQQPFSTSHITDSPISLYAATKKSNELLAHSYSHLYNIPMTGLRFFTVYGPFGRPDMAYYKFTKLIANGRPIDVFNNGKMKRDFTYIDDIVEGIFRITESALPTTKSQFSSGKAPFEVFNIGNNQPVSLDYFISIIEELLNIKAELNYMPMQAGDVPITYADIEPLEQKCGFKPSTSIENGMERFIKWYLEYNKK